MLGTRRLSWVDLLAFVEHSPRGSALARDILGDAADWGLLEHLQASTVDAVNVGNWQRQQKKNAPRPKPIKRPGATAEQKFGAGAMPISEFKAWWDSH